MMDVRIREEKVRKKSRYMVEAKRENVEGRIYWLPLASFARLDKALSWCVGRNYNIQVHVGDDKWINVEHVELSN